MENEPLNENYGEDEDSEVEELLDDSEEDPTFDIIDETLSDFSNLSLKKSKSRNCSISNSKVLDSTSQEDPDEDDIEIKLPELDEKDLKSFENVERLIADGQLEKLKVDQCKVYLRKNGLRLMGTKVVLIERIREHLGIINGGGELKYPPSSFVLNCKGDACNRDVVMFEQNVYEMYNIASRSATGPPCGTRIVAGRIVKESYGSAKQQHTFTIEVLWSKGVKPLPPLHPLLIKGRNLYKLKTMRQLWVDEEARRKVLLEKHSRGYLARSDRETRIQEKEKKMMHKGQRVTRKTNVTAQEQKRQLVDHSRNFPSRVAVQPQEQEKVSKSTIHLKQSPQFEQHNPAFPPRTVLTTISDQNNYQLQQNINIKSHYSNTLIPNTGFPHNSVRSQGSYVIEQHHNGMRAAEKYQSNGLAFANNMQNHFSGRSHQSHDANANKSSFHSRPGNPTHIMEPVMQPRVCQYYPQGRCHFGENCKYLHEDRGKQFNDGRIAAKNSYSNAYESVGNSPPWSPTRRSSNHPSQSPTRRSFNHPPRSPTRGSSNVPSWSPSKRSFNHPPLSPTRGNPNNPPWNPNRASSNKRPWSPNGGPIPMHKQVCRYYENGRCYHGENCKYLHERR